MDIVQDGAKRRTSDGFFHGETPHPFPEDLSFEHDDFIAEYIVKGWTPPAPFLSREAPIVALGPCFATDLDKYLDGNQFNVLTRKPEAAAYTATMTDRIANTHAVLQQFEWAWENKAPQAGLWHGKSAESLACDEKVRLETKAQFDSAECFVITFGTSEVWFDEPTGEVFWGAVPEKTYDPTRHKFRVATMHENYENLVKTYNLIRQNRPRAAIVLSLSPVPLAATSRPVSGIAANAVSKANLRAAIDELFQNLGGRDPRCFYFPAYEIVLNLYRCPWTKDRRHVYAPVLNFNLQVFERYFCESTLADEKLREVFRATQALDLKRCREGHLSAPEADSTGAREPQVRAEARRKKVLERRAARKAERKAARLEAKKAKVPKAPKPKKTKIKKKAVKETPPPGNQAGT